MIVFDEEREFLAEFAYIQAQKQEEEEWQWMQEQIKFDSKRKPAGIKVRFNEQLIISNDRIEADC
jgi:hypothetical protein